MTFFGVLTLLGQLALAAMGAIVVFTAFVVIAGIAYPPLLAPLFP